MSLDKIPTDNASDTQLTRTALYNLHLEHSARMVPFEGYEMPVQYPAGIINEHTHVRTKAGLFDVSHMGQVLLISDSHEAVSEGLSQLVCGAVKSLKNGSMRYTLLMNENGGIVDDLIVSRSICKEDDGSLSLVVNAGRKAFDYIYLEENLPDNIRVEPLPDKSLLALQGPQAAEVISRFAPIATQLKFMSTTPTKLAGFDCHISRSGYTGEDGFEISVSSENAEDLARILLSEDEVMPIGLGARDSLRLEAGLCLYGHDLNETTTPVEADLVWTISKKKKQDGGFLGADIIRSQLDQGVSRKRVCIKLNGRAPAREGAEVKNLDGEVIGALTSGGYAPTLKEPIAMGYIQSGYTEVGTNLQVVVRGRSLDGQVVKPPFVPHRYSK